MSLALALGSVPITTVVNETCCICLNTSVKKQTRITAETFIPANPVWIPVKRRSPREVITVEHHGIMLSIRRPVKGAADTPALWG